MCRQPGVSYGRIWNKVLEERLISMLLIRMSRAVSSTTIRPEPIHRVSFHVMSTAAKRLKLKSSTKLMRLTMAPTIV